MVQLTHMYDRTKQLFLNSQTDFFELFNGMLLFTWGGWLLLPFDTFHNVGAFSVLARLMPETAFALIPFSLGIFILYTITTFKVRRRNKALIASTALWVFICIIIGAASATSTGLPVYGTIALFNALTYLRR